MGYYELDGEQVVECVVRALGADSPLLRHFPDVYRGVCEDPGDQAVARFIDEFFCVVQEAIGDAEVRTEGPYWTEAVAFLDGEDE